MPIWLGELKDIITLSLGFGNLCIMVYAFSKFLNKPTKTQDDRLDDHDEKFKQLDTRINNMEARLNEGSVHFKALDEATSVTQGSLVAIMDSLLCLVPDGKDKDKLKEKRDDLFEYLIDK